MIAFVLVSWRPTNPEGQPEHSLQWEFPGLFFCSVERRRSEGQEAIDRSRRRWPQWRVQQGTASTWTWLPPLTASRTECDANTQCEADSAAKGTDTRFRCF